MANIIGLITVNGKQILEVDADPSAAGGTPAPIASLAMYDSGVAGTLYLKSGALDTAWTTVDITPSWDLAGNALTGATSDAPNEFIGSTNDYDVVLKRNNIEQARVQNAAFLIGLNATLGGRLQINDAAAGTDLVKEILDAAGANAIIKTTRMNRVTTVGAATSTYDVAIPTNYTALVEAKVNVRQTSGTSGVAGEGASYIRTLHSKNDAGTASIFQVQSSYTYEIVAGMNFTAGVSGANVRFSCLGVANRNFTWGAHTTLLMTNT